MKNILYTSLGIVIGLLLILALFFLYHKPELKKSYELGYSDCLKSIKDSIEIIEPKPITHSLPIVESKPTIIKKDSTYEINKLFISSANDSVFVRARSKDFNTELSLIDFRKSEILPGYITRTIVRYLPSMDSTSAIYNYDAYEFQPFSYLIGALSVLIVEIITLSIIYL